MCSAFSYCLNILDTVYIWHGCGSTEPERQAAVQYSSRITKGSSQAIQLHEGDDDADDLFWMALGDSEYARADYWQWRRQTAEVDPRIWRIDAGANLPVSILKSNGMRSYDNHNLGLSYSVSEGGECTNALSIHTRLYLGIFCHGRA